MKEDMLRSWGLNDKEVRIYLANLKLGSSSVQKIANFAAVNRTSTYDLLKSLERKGFASYTIQSGKKYYHATNPNKLSDILKEREDMLKKALPELQNISESIVKRPKVEIYTGKDGLKNIFEDILNTAKSFEGIASKKQLFKLFKYYLPHFVERRKKKGIKVRLINETEPYDTSVPYKLMKSKIKTATWLYNGKIAMISLEESEPIGILIEEKNFFKSQKMMFDFMWDHL
jgi:sugar-specific transcriptional regulator TrmB